jgi:type 2 lantibiotic biosynthesis protein LanM
MKEMREAEVVHPQIVEQTSSWYNALTLSERLRSFRSLAPDTQVPSHKKSEIAARRLQKWKMQPPFANDLLFTQRLAADGLSEDEFAYLLGEPIEALQERFPMSPEWIQKLHAAFEGSIDASNLRIRGEEQMPIVVNLLKPLKPLFAQSLQCLQAAIIALSQEYEQVPFDIQTIGDLCLPDLLNRLFPIFSKTLTLELNIARLQDKLAGETSEERFRSFIEQICEPKAFLSLLEDYPVLARQLVTTTDYWLAYTLELLRHLCTDWNEICETLTPEHEPGRVTEVKFGVGDTHRQGRSVVQLRFDSGFQLLYKPKSLSIDTHFQLMLSWINKRGEHAPFYITKLLDKGKYGWSEFIQAQECTSAQELERFYERQGGYLALLYALNATDLHFENVIASGEHPVLIDLESFFQADLYFSKEDTAAYPPGAELLRTSVLRTNLLPLRTFRGGNQSIDISGLSGAGGQLTPRPVPQWNSAGTDQMRLVRQRIKIADRQNRPTLSGTEIDPLQYVEHIARGFTKVYRTLIHFREDFRQEILPLFAHDEIRIIARATQIYVNLLQESWHPTLLHNALERDRFLDRLWLTVQHHPRFARLIPAEQEDMHEGDIPLFTTYPDTRHLYSSRGTCIANFFDEPCIEFVKKRIDGLCEKDLDRQLWLINAAFATLTQGTGKASWKSTFLQPTHRQVTRERLLDAAQTVGDRLLEQVLQHENDVSWLGLHLLNDQNWSITPVGIDLYSGTAGICLFLAYLGSITREARYLSLAHTILTSIRQQIHLLKEKKPMLGGFSGWGGFIYLYTHLGVLWHDHSLLEECEELSAFVAAYIDGDDNFDIVSGAAGYILALITLHQATSSPRVLASAIHCGEHLLQHAHSMQQGIGWLTPISQMPLTGFSHGTAGIAFSLLQLAEVSGDERFKTVALQALTYERSLFLPNLQNWPDLRDGTTTGPDEHLITWCHGAPGIGLARLASLHSLDDETIREEIAIALKTTLTQGFGQNHSLCHGDLGNLELFLTASQTFDKTRYAPEVENITAMILDSLDQQGWCTGVPLSIETPGLMTGISGIGYELLRLAEPDRVPSVLVLAPPVKPQDKR